MLQKIFGFQYAKQLISLFLMGFGGNLFFNNHVQCRQTHLDQVKINHFILGQYLLPHPEKVDKGGEDALYADSGILSVADGVGGWNQRGIDPSQYARALCQNAGQMFNKNPGKYSKNPKQLLKEAQSPIREQGSSTFVIVTMDRKTPKIYTSYMGDSGYIILRENNNSNYDVIYQFKEQQKSFNFPYQLGHYAGDSPDLAEEYNHNIKNSDIIIVGSDGLFDNIDANQIKDQILAFKQKYNQIDQHLQQITESIGKQAREYALKRNYMSPFAQRAQESGYSFIGGKLDDIAVIVSVAKIVENSDTVGSEL